MSKKKKETSRDPHQSIHSQAALPWINRKYKDSLFRIVFREKANLLSLYNVVNGTTYTDPDDLKIMTLEDAVYLGIKNDIGFLLGFHLNLYEHQSTWNPNMPLRGLPYFSETYNAYIDLEHLRIYSRKKLALPVPSYIVFYNGTEDFPDRAELLLSNLFQKAVPSDTGSAAPAAEGTFPNAGSAAPAVGGILPDADSADPAAERISPALECRAVMLNINAGHNRKLMEKCRPLADYAAFVQKTRECLAIGLPLQQALDRTVNYCIENDILADILRKNKAEVMNLLLTTYDKELHEKTIREDGFEDGFASGRAREKYLLNKLTRLLINNNRMDDLKRSVEDPAWQEILMKEYGLDE